MSKADFKHTHTYNSISFTPHTYTQSYKILNVAKSTTSMKDNINILIVVISATSLSLLLLLL